MVDWERKSLDAPLELGALAIGQRSPFFTTSHMDCRRQTSGDGSRTPMEAKKGAPGLEVAIPRRLKMR